MNSGAPQASIVVFASGRGSNFRALCEAQKRGELPVKIEALVTNVCGAGACEIARAHGVRVIEVAHAGLKRAAHEEAVSKALSAVRADWLVLAGYMRLFTPAFIERYFDKRIGAARIVNIHPSLLPSFAGTDGYAQALRYGVKVTGVTVHLVGAGLDDGPIVAQRALEVRDDDTQESLMKRGLEIEHSLYVQALRDLVTKPWSIQTGRLDGGRPRVVFE